MTHVRIPGSRPSIKIVFQIRRPDEWASLCAFDKFNATGRNDPPGPFKDHERAQLLTKRKALSIPVGGLIRFVLVEEPTGRRSFFRTGASASAADILRAVAVRLSIERSISSRCGHIPKING
jgi:hypothetical protein